MSARGGGQLAGFVNVIWDGSAHAWIQDVMVAPAARRERLGTQLVEQAREGAREAGCEWLHVDFEEHLAPLPWTPAASLRPAGLIRL